MNCWLQLVKQSCAKKKEEIKYPDGKIKLAPKQQEVLSFILLSRVRGLKEWTKVEEKPH